LEKKRLNFHLQKIFFNSTLLSYNVVNLNDFTNTAETTPCPVGYARVDFVRLRYATARFTSALKKGGEEKQDSNPPLL